MMSRSKTAALLVVALVAMGASAAGAQTVLGQVAMNELKIDGVLVPTGTTVLSPSLIETGPYAGVVHLSNGRTLSLAPNSRAYLKTVGEGIELRARSGGVEVGSGRGEPFKLASNTVALLAAGPDESDEPPTGEPTDAVKMCRDEDDPVWVTAGENTTLAEEIRKRIDLGWGVAGVRPYDEDCDRMKGFFPILWTPAKIAAVAVGTAGVTAVVSDNLQEDRRVEIRCQSADASPLEPGVPICGT